MAGVGLQYALCWFFLTRSSALSALRVFKHHLSLVRSPPHSAPLDVRSPQIHFIDFKHPPVLPTLIPPAHLFFFFWQSLKAQSGWYPAHLTAATTNRFLWPSVNVKPSKWLLLSHPPWPHLISILLFPTLYLLLASLTYFPLLHFHLILPCILPPNF